MLTRIKIRNFKRFGNVEVDLGNPVVFIGPNNSGKSALLSAIDVLVGQGGGAEIIMAKRYRTQ